MTPESCASNRPRGCQVQTPDLHALRPSNTLPSLYQPSIPLGPRLCLLSDLTSTPRHFSLPLHRPSSPLHSIFHLTNPPPHLHLAIMGVEKQTIKAGDGVTKPQNGDKVTMEYTGYLQTADGSKGKQ